MTTNLLLHRKQELCLEFSGNSQKSSSQFEKKEKYSRLTASNRISSKHWNTIHHTTIIHWKNFITSTRVIRANLFRLWINSLHDISTIYQWQIVLLSCKELMSEIEWINEMMTYDVAFHLHAVLVEWRLAFVLELEQYSCRLKCAPHLNVYKNRRETLQWNQANINYLIW